MLPCFVYLSRANRQANDWRQQILFATHLRFEESSYCVCLSYHVCQSYLPSWPRYVRMASVVVFLATALGFQTLHAFKLPFYCSTFMTSSCSHDCLKVEVEYQHIVPARACRLKPYEGKNFSDEALCRPMRMPYCIGEVHATSCCSEEG